MIELLRPQLRKYCHELRREVIDYMRYRGVKEEVIRKYERDSLKFDPNNPSHVFAFVLWSLQYVASFAGFIFGVGIEFVPFEEALESHSAYVIGIDKPKGLEKYMGVKAYGYEREKRLYNLFHIVFNLAQGLMLFSNDNKKS